MTAQVYENRRNRQRKLLEIGIIVSLGLHLVTLQSSKKLVLGYLPAALTIPDIDVIDVVQTQIERKAPPPLLPTIPIPSDDPFLDPEISIEPTGFTFGTPLGEAPPWFDKEAANEPEFEFVPYDRAPVPIGGMKAIAANLTYPELARRAGIEGRVTIYALIGIDGKVSKTRIIETLDFAGMTEAAEKAIKAVEWQPAQQRDRKVAVWMAIPVDFKLAGN